jgi:glycosyltransferase involved in cell wall biosynthesis
MRICVVARIAPAHGIGGMQDHTTDLALGLVRAGHEVEVVTGSHPDGRRTDEAGGVRWHFVDAPSGDFTDPRWRAQSLQAFLRLHRDRPFDVVHGEGSSALELVRTGALGRVPVVVMFHGNFIGLVKASLRRQLATPRPREVLREQRGLLHLSRRHFAKGNWRVFRACEAIVPSRQQLADTCRSHLLDPERVHVVPNGVDASVFRPRPRDELRAELALDNGFVYACAGRLSREKGTHHAIRTLAAIPDARLLVVGDGPDREPLEALARDLGVAGRVVFAGAQPPEKMPLYLSASDVFLFPTERDEAAPLVLPQAMACGLPVVATARGGIPELVGRSGENALIVPPADDGALVDAARRLRADPQLRAFLGASARRRIEDGYTVEKMVESTVAVYETARRRHSR